MPNTITLKQHDLEPSPRATLLSGTGVNEGPINLTGATAVASVIRPIGGGTTIRRTCTVIDPLVGLVSFAWTTPDTANVGSFYQEWEIVWAGSRPQTVPNSSYNLIVIEDDLD